VGCQREVSAPAQVVLFERGYRIIRHTNERVGVLQEGDNYEPSDSKRMERSHRPVSSQAST
jgi:hypothetical protein